MEPIAPPPPPAPRSLGQVLDAGFDVVRSHGVLLVGLWALVYVPLAFAGALAPEGGAKLPPEQAVWLVLATPLVALAMLVVTLAATDASGDALHGRPTDAGQALRRGLARLPAMLGAAVAFLGVALVTLLPLAAVAALRETLGALAVPALLAAALLPFVAMLRLTLLTQVVVFERLGGLGALARAHRLIDGHVLRVLGTYLVVGLLVALLGGAVGLAVGALPTIGPAAVGLVQALGSAYSSAVGVVLYEEVRARKGEGAPPSAVPPAHPPGP